MSSLLEQLRSDLPDHTHRRRVYLPTDGAEVERIANLARQLDLKAVRYLLTLEKFEERPTQVARQEAYDRLIDALNDIVAKLALMKPLERSTEKSDD